MINIKKYPAEIVSVKELSQGVFRLDLRSLARPFKFYPGQFLHLAIDETDHSSPWPDSRCFSIQTKPNSEYLSITYSVKGSFTGRMEKELEKGSIVTLKMPYGDLFSNDHSKLNTVFLAGGTGITPFLSLFGSDLFRDYTNPVLFAGFRNKDFYLYEEELSKAKESNPTFKVIIGFEDRDGYFDAETIRNNMVEDNVIFISGPLPMIQYYRNYLLENNIEGARVRTDDWE